jgi:hypothetical protein
MFLKILVTASFLLVQTENMFDQEPAALTARALELIQKNEKSKALRLLEQAFEKSSDSMELREISALILEASPLNYPKREGHLKYLVKFNAESEDAWSWYKELGDRAFEAGKASEAEDWYLRAMPTAKDKNLVRYKLSWAQWNLKNRVSALQGFLEVFPTAEESLRNQLVREIPRLWWEIGPLASDVFEKILALPEDVLAPMMAELLEKSPMQHEPTVADQALLSQVKSDGRTKAYLSKAILAGTIFPKSPCFLFNSLLTPDDSYSPESFLACLKSPKRPPPTQLMTYFERYTGEPNEKFEWARAELLEQLGRVSDACTQSLQAPGLSSHSKAFIHYLSMLVMKPSEAELKGILQLVSNEPFEILLKMEANPSLLERLQSIDAQTWLAFEEKNFNGRKPSKAFLLKKGVWLAEKSELLPDEKNAQLLDIFQKLLERPAKGSEEKVKKNFDKLLNLSSTTLPATFSNSFKKSYDTWLSSLDECLSSLSNAEAEWQVIARPLFKQEVKKSIDSLVAQLDATTLDPELSALSETFTQKKEELKSELRRKYLESSGE